jgi:hypothetical protein
MWLKNNTGVVADKTIEDDEEITVNYNLFAGGAVSFVCQCGAPSCVRSEIVVGEPELEGNEPEIPDVSTNKRQCKKRERIATNARRGASTKPHGFVSAILPSCE